MRPSIWILNFGLAVASLDPIPYQHDRNQIKPIPYQAPSNNQIRLLKFNHHNLDQELEQLDLDKVAFIGIPNDFLHQFIHYLLNTELLLEETKYRERMDQFDINKRLANADSKSNANYELSYAGLDILIYLNGMLGV